MHTTPEHSSCRGHPSLLPQRCRSSAWLCGDFLASCSCCCARGRLGSSRPRGLSPLCFPSAVLFQHLIIYRGLCGRLCRGSYCLIELLDSSTAKIITHTQNCTPGLGGITHPVLSSLLRGSPSSPGWEWRGVQRFPAPRWELIPRLCPSLLPPILHDIPSAASARHPQHCCVGPLPLCWRGGGSIHPNLLSSTDECLG